MALSTYTELKTSIADWLNRDDLTAVIPDFVSLAESQIERRLPVQKLVKRATATIDTPFFAVPADYVYAKSLILTSASPTQQLVFISQDEMDAKKVILLTTGKPRYFTAVGGQFEVLPAPDGSYTGELTYVARLEKLSGAVASNWLLSQYPDAYLYGSLLQAAPYLRDDERIAVWGSLYEKAIEEIIVQDQRASFSGGRLAMAVKPTRVIP